MGTVASAETFHKCECVDRVQESHDVFTLVLQKCDRSSFDFIAGQFVTIRFSWNDRHYARVFTIASPPTRPDRIALTIKAAPTGNATRLLHDHFHSGSIVEIGRAGGDFVLHGRSVNKVVFLCAGSGITPMMSMLRNQHDRGEPLDLCFIQCARSESDVLFERELHMLAQRMPTLKLAIFCSQPSGRASHYSGRLDRSRLAQLVPDVAERTAFVCGPESFMGAMCRNLLEAGTPAERIFEEAFGLRPSTSEPSDEKASIAFERSQVRVEADGNATILDTAEASGVYIDTACRSGVCGTCKARLICGQVDMMDLGGLSHEERQDGYILACCSRPIGPIALDL